MTVTVVGLGANLGDRVATLRAATARISAVTPILRVSRIWESTPIGGPPQPDFLNAAVLVDWGRPPLALLDALAAIEAELGRVRTVVNGPRTIDLDILWIEGQVVDLPRLVIPHPRLHERAFAIVPLLEVVKDARDPRTGALYAAPHDQRLRPVADLLN